MFQTLKEKLGFVKKKATSEKEIFSDGLLDPKIRAKKLDEILYDLGLALIEADVALPVIEEIKSTLRKELLGKKVDRTIGIEQAIEFSLKASIRKVLTAKNINFDDFIAHTPKPVVLLFVGVNGTGKTTAIAKLAYRLLTQNHSCVIAASDTFRAGAIEQLERHAEKLGVRLIKHRPGADSAAVAYDAIEHAKARNRDVVLIDTAGRMQTNLNLMEEMKKLKRVSKPHMTIFVGDALAGNDAIEQARTFDRELGVDCTILTKIDADAKGGAALSIAHTIKKPIIFVGTGQRYEDLIGFDADWFIGKLFES